MERNRNQLIQESDMRDVFMLRSELGSILTKELPNVPEAELRSLVEIYEMAQELTIKFFEYQNLYLTNRENLLY